MYAGCVDAIRYKFTVRVAAWSRGEGTRLLLVLVLLLLLLLPLLYARRVTFLLVRLVPARPFK